MHPDFILLGLRPPGSWRGNLPPSVPVPSSLHSSRPGRVVPSSRSQESSVPPSYSTVSSHFPLAAPRPLGCEFLGGPQCSGRPCLAEACPAQPSTCDPDGGQTGTPLGGWGLQEPHRPGAGLVWRLVERLAKTPRAELPRASLPFLKPLRCVHNACSFHGPPAKVHVRVVLKTYVISPWESEWTETFFFFSPLNEGWEGGRSGKVFCFFTFSLLL